jgi:hypothetical protein
MEHEGRSAVHTAADRHSGQRGNGQGAVSFQDEFEVTMKQLKGQKGGPKVLFEDDFI